MLAHMSFTWQTRTAAGALGETLPRSRAPRGAAAGLVERTRALAGRLPRPELIALLLLAGALDLWALSRNGWANQYYSAAVRSMSTSWHDFLFASLDRSGVMTVDKPPLSLWVQALSVRAFGFHPLSVLVPQALMGVASVALVYDLVRRRFGRLGGFFAGLALALTPITVAVSRHNNPDALLVLCSVAAVWCAVRAFEDRPARSRTRWLALAGVCVGLGFETKMGVALTVVPGIAAAWLWIAPAGRGRLHALRQLLLAGAAMLVVAGAWPALVELTPASQRPWVSGTGDNRILSLIFGYNGLGRVDGQSGGPGGLGGGSMFGGSPGPLRLLNSALGGQAGWLLGFALAAGLALVLSTRLRRADPRSGWLLCVGGAFLTTAVLFSAAGGIFHPYYVSLLAPFAAALVGAGVAQLRGGDRAARVLAPLAVLAGVVVELVVRARYPGQLAWLVPVLVLAAVLAVPALALARRPGVRAAVLGGVLAVLLIAPGVWAFDTLGYAASGTFPSGGPAGVAQQGGPGGPGGFGGVRARGHAGGFGPPGALGARAGAGAPLPGAAGAVPPSSAGATGGPAAATGRFPAGGPGAGGFGGGAGGGGFGAGGSLTRVAAYVRAHGGGTIAVSSQSSASAAILAGAEVAGIGGFSGRESDVSVAWLAEEVAAGRIRWVLAEGSGAQMRLPGDTRAGSQAAMSAAAQACTRVTLSGTSSVSAGGAGAGSSASGQTLYDCRGDAAGIARAGGASAS
jgi:4-amino-4-deoxy-L-arabinose transferase-like glycosyltransferase